MTTERRRRLLCAVLLAVAILGAGTFTTSVLAADPAWRFALQVAGLGACAAAAGAAAVVLRRWSADDDFWWLDSDSDRDP
jgi:hypothetical protein